MSIIKFNEKFNNIIQSDYESLAGYIINEIGRMYMLNFLLILQVSSFWIEKYHYLI